MKNFILSVIIIALLPVLGCGAGNPDNNVENDKSAGLINTKSETTKAKSESINEAGKVAYLTKAEFLEKVMNFEKNPDQWVFEGDIPCVIDFYADWCQPCRIAGPILEELAMEYAGKIKVYKIDTEKEKELAGAFGIRSIPAFLWCPKEGQPQMSNGIARTPEETKEMFKKIIDDLLL
jgi:thioredoxin